MILSYMSLIFALAFSLVPMPSHALAEGDFRDLEETIHRELTPSERSDIQSVFYRINALDVGTVLLPVPRAVIICASADIDIWFTSSIAGCVDRHLNRYYFLSGGTGFTVGISVNAFAVALYSDKTDDITGTYVGTQIGSSLGRYGFNAGFYFRGLTDNSVVDLTDRIYLIGPTAGVNFDVSAAFIKIGRL
jgi:hypothetical protein